MLDTNRFMLKTGGQYQMLGIRNSVCDPSVLTKQPINQVLRALRN